MKRLFAVVGAFAVVLGLMTSVSAQAGPKTIRVRELDGVKLASGGRLWVHVYHARGGIPGPPGGGGGGGGGSCTDTNTQTAYTTFAPAKAASMAFRLTAGSVPSYLGSSAVSSTVNGGFNAWNAVHNYYSYSNSGGASQPADDGTNSVGFGWFVGSGAGSALAATWSWTDSSGRIKGADIFFNTRFTFGIFSTCNAQNTYEMGDIITHEIGHTAGLGHVSDAQAQATMYPSAPAGETRKRTLTTGDKNGFEAQV
jgi:Matrixin